MNEFYAHAVLEVCALLGGIGTGSMHESGDHDADAKASWLAMRIAAWKPGSECFRAYDNAVLDLAKEALRLFRARRIELPKGGET